MRNGSYVSVWSVKKGSGNYYDVQISCSRKRKDTGEYARDFQGFVRFIGGAAEFISKYDGFNAKDNNNQPLRIKVVDMSVSNSYNREKDVTYWNVAVFGCESNDGSSSQTAPTSDSFVDIPDGIDAEELPFK
jgi:hypothetical protein